MSLGSPRVLLVNDDGPPCAESPYILGLYQHLTNNLSEYTPSSEWNVRVVIPSSQKSWIGKAYHINEVTHGRYFYPRGPDGVEGETSDTPRQLREKEIAEWILLDGVRSSGICLVTINLTSYDDLKTPATCTNVALHNLYPGEIDLVISGPNFGRNTSAAFSLSSGTIGAAMSAALSRTRAIAISYGSVLHPTPLNLHEPAHKLSACIVEYLWTNWGKDPDGTRDSRLEVNLYNVNLPMIHKLMDPEGLQVYWTCMWRNSYGRLFKHVPAAHGSQREPLPDNSHSLSGLISAGSVAQSDAHLAFKFAPDIQPLVNPDLSTVPVGTDGWAFGMGHASITPLRSSFAEADFRGTDNLRKLKL